jgi:undecaprenyl-diphosphatase
LKNKKTLEWIASTLLLFFVILGYTVKFYPSKLVSIDSSIQSFIRSFRTHDLDTLVLSFTQCFNPQPAVFLVFALLLFLLLTSRKAEALWTILSVIVVTLLLNPVFKLVFQRPRPSVSHLVHETSYSFPSGHSSFAFLFFGLLLVFFNLNLTNKTMQYIASSICMILACLVGLSRIYVGVHFPSDVLAGALLSASWLTFSYPIFDKQRFIWRFKSIQK